MKKISQLLALICCFYLLPAQAKLIVPKALHGFWGYKATKVGNWNGPLIGDNFVEFNYRLYLVKRVENTGANYKIWLNTGGKDSLTLEIKKTEEGKALLKFSKWTKEILCSWSASDPDIKLYQPGAIPAPYFNKWINVSSMADFYINAKQKMHYQNRDWDIAWGGNYRGEEERFLLKYKDSCRMVYVRKQGKALKVNSLEGPKIYVPMAKNPLVYKFLGNWINSETNGWQYGFFEDFAIHNQRVYAYKNIEKDGNDLKIALLDGDKEKNIRLTAKNDSVAKLVDDQGTSTVYLLKKQFKPGAIKDTLAFKNTHFTKPDTAVITGYLRNRKNFKPFSVSFMDYLKDEEVHYYGDLDSNGFFTVKIPLLNTSQVFLNWDRNGVIDVIEPGEHYFYFEDSDTKLRSAMGDNAGFHNELLNYDYYGPYRKISETDYNAKTSADLLSFLAISKKEYDNGTAYLSNHLKKYPNASSRFKYFVTEGYKYEFASNLMDQRFKLKMDEKFPESFMKFVDDSLYKNTPPRPFTLIRDFSLFNRDYYNYLRNEISVKWDDVVVEMINSGEMKLSIQEKEAVLAQIELNKTVAADSLKTKHLFKIFTAEKQKLAENTRELYREQIMNNANKKLQIKSLDVDVKVANSISDEDLRQGIVARRFFQYFENNHTAMPATSFQHFMGNLKNTYYRDEIGKLQLTYQNLSKVDPEYEQSLKRTDHLKGAKNADSLFAALIKPYKGKVIYVDFWGTWCGPCKGEMPYVQAAKEALKGKDVVFMYFANRSPEEAWKNIINEYHLTSENAVHYRLPDEQQYLLEARLSVNSFPTYMLIDKEGNVSTMKAPRPSDKNQLVTAVSALLDK